LEGESVFILTKILNEQHKNIIMTKKEIAQAFSGGNFDKCLPYLTSETFWNTPGEQYLKGKNDIEAFCKKVAASFNSITTNFNQLNLIENNNCVAINGTAEFLRDGEKISFVSSCDVYEFDEKNNIVSIHSYCITEKP
jgi:SnoaL-like domain